MRNLILIHLGSNEKRNARRTEPTHGGLLAEALNLLIQDNDPARQLTGYTGSWAGKVPAKESRGKYRVPLIGEKNGKNRKKTFLGWRRVLTMNFEA